ncbi:hypothetical protein B0H67DRAFT_108048 [Lasiosphaeris hirsuta]|uniref:Uncharacterized protein n=1 Tax=Lasiosphaeris hirsuta TaxID=260670 RepID=A0AA40E1J6_9PEZI|nr:hypothetical protein B0H67DRAFT_108048 [Lasiosphaeris hirsuta]
MARGRPTRRASILENLIFPSVLDSSSKPRKRKRDQSVDRGHLPTHDGWTKAEPSLRAKRSKTTAQGGAALDETPPKRGTRERVAPKGAAPKKHATTKGSIPIQATSGKKSGPKGEDVLKPGVSESSSDSSLDAHASPVTSRVTRATTKRLSQKRPASNPRKERSQAAAQKKRPTVPKISKAAETRSTPPPQSVKRRHDLPENHPTPESIVRSPAARSITKNSLLRNNTTSQPRETPPTPLSNNAPCSPLKKTKTRRPTPITTVTRSPLTTPPNDLRLTDTVTPAESLSQSEKGLLYSPIIPSHNLTTTSPSLKPPPTPIIREPDDFAYFHWRAKRTRASTTHSLLPKPSFPKPSFPKQACPKAEPTRPLPTTSPSPATTSPSLATTSPSPRPRSPSPNTAPTTAQPLWTSTPKPPLARPWPLHVGSILCEPCFHTDVARWLRTRRNVANILRLLGGDGALEAMRKALRFAGQAELSWEGIEDAKRRARDREREERLLAERKGLPAHLLVGVDTAKSEGVEPVELRWWVPGSGVVIKKGVVVEERTDKVVSKLERDERGLLLLRREVARRVAEGQENVPGVDELLDGLRVEVGLEKRELDGLEKRFAEMLEQWGDISVRDRDVREVIRTAPSVERPKKWKILQKQWWAFDATLQDAYRKLQSTKTESGTASQSEFDVTIAAKAREAAITPAETRTQHVSLETQDENGKQKETGLGKQNKPVKANKKSERQEFNRLVKTLELNATVEENLKKIGDQIAQVTFALQKQGKLAKPSSSKEIPDTHSSKPQLDQGKDAVPKMSDLLPQELKHSGDDVTLPCLYCSESGAANRRLARKPRYTSMQAENMYRKKPWIKPLMWVYKNGSGSENATSTAKNLFELIDKRGSFALQPIPGLSFQVDRSGGEVRIVLMEMKSIYDEIPVTKPGAERVGEDAIGGFGPFGALGVVDKFSNGEYMGSRSIFAKNQAKDEA